AEAEWHFSGFQQDQTLKTIVRKGRNEWVDGHALHLPINSASPNHVNWDTVCTVACAALTRGANEHITAFQIHFDSDWAWNLDYTASHGTFTNLDMRSVAAHEWGHVVGLGHSTRGYGHDCASGSGTMGTMAQGTAGCINNGHTEQRSISVKDEEGRCEIYSHAHGYSC
ncbi:MAG: matrixin family metalloprotease, partial [Actinomycetota bacterium]